MPPRLLAPLGPLFLGPLFLGPLFLGPLLLVSSFGCGGASEASAGPLRAAHPPGVQHGMHHRFEHPETWAPELDAPERDAWQQPERVIEALALPPGAVVADLGAGTGYFAVRLARAVPAGRVLALDLEASMVRYLADRAGREGLPNMFAGESTETDAGLRETVDLVLVVNTYHHLADRTAYFERLRARLRGDGRVAILDFRLGSDRGPPREHKIAPDVVQRELEAAGYRLLEQHEFLTDQYFLVFGAAR
jgi:SAM-dependent methyltransferase